MKTLIQIPNKIHKPRLKRLRDQILTLERARIGFQQAKETLKTSKARVWDEDEIHALNYYLQVKDSLTTNNRQASWSKIKVRRAALSIFKKQEAEVLWVKYIESGYYLMCCSFEDGVLALWVSAFRGEVFTPICDVTQWSEYKDQGGD